MKIFRICIALFLLTSASSLHAQCDFGAHDASAAGAWLSCSESPNPNEELGTGHWIMYDLGAAYHLYDSHIWNYNVTSGLGQGVRNCRFDVSVDGVNWSYWGNFEVAQATGSSEYTGDIGPYFDGVVARFLLMSIESNWGGDDCSGFAEIRVDREEADVSVEELAGLEISAFPNPASQQLTIRHYAGGSARLQIFQSDGSLFLDQRMQANTEQLNVQDWPAGLYIVHISSGDQQGTVRVVVQP